jgi:hypothetical protein
MALNMGTHEFLNQYIAQNSLGGFSLDNCLRDRFGFGDGVKQQLNNVRVEDWLKKGGREEDYPPDTFVGGWPPYRRSRNHFHNPIPPSLDNAGFTDWFSFCDVGHCPVSAIRWAQGPQNSDFIYNLNWGPIHYDVLDLNPGGDWSWSKTRQYFFTGLISTDKGVRDINFAYTFQGLGQVMHLLEDMSVPDHTRNTFHPPYSHDYEDFVSSKITNATKALQFSPADSQYFAGTINGIASLFDADQYTGNNSEITLSNTVGLSEFSNANFYSNRSLLSSVFNYPDISNVYERAEPVANRYGKIDNAYYVYINGQSNKLAAKSYVAPHPKLVGKPGSWKYNLDNRVYDDYAKVLIPRAIAYSSQLLGYFFRGTIDVQYVPETSSFRSISVTARNTTSNGDAMPWGDVYLVVRYHELQENPDGTIGYVPGDYQYRVYQLPYLTSIPGANLNPLPLTFDLSSNPLPFRISDVTLQLVYKGYLGNEGTAVAVGNAIATTLGTNIDISPPTNGVYAIATDNIFTNFTLAAKTNIPGGLVDPNGIIELEVEYREATSDPFASPVVDTLPTDASTYYFRVPEKNGVKSLPWGQSVELQFDLSELSIPVYATDVYINLVYRRATDPATKWLAVGRRDISEPTPVDILNNTDKICIFGQWYDSGSQAAFDATGRNATVDIQPETVANYHYTVSTVTDPKPVSPTNYAFFDTNLLGPGVHRRIGYILTDYAFKYSVSPSVINDGTAIKNQLLADDETRFFYPVPILRGNRMWSGAEVIFMKAPYPVNSICDITVLPPAGQ